MFAFAVTLLVVSLEVPHTFDELWLAMRQFFAFAICFALLFQVWWRHFNFFRRYGLEDAPTIVADRHPAVRGAVLRLPAEVRLHAGGRSRSSAFRLTNAGSRRAGASAIADTPRLMQIYSGGVVAVFIVFALMYGNAFRKRERARPGRPRSSSRRDSTSSTTRELRSSASLSVPIATFGGPLAAAAVAGPMYFLIGPFKWLALGAYSALATNE